MKNLSRGESGIQSSTSSRKQKGEKRKNKKCRKDSGSKKKLKKIKRDKGDTEMITLNCILITFKRSLRYVSCFFILSNTMPFLSKNLMVDTTTLFKIAFFSLIPKSAIHYLT